MFIIDGFVCKIDVIRCYWRWPRLLLLLALVTQQKRIFASYCLNYSIYTSSSGFEENCSRYVWYYVYVALNEWEPQAIPAAGTLT